MKKYNRLMLVTVIGYLLLALLSAYLVYQTGGKDQKEYNVEINRIQRELSQGQRVETLNLKGYKYIKKITLLTLDEARNKKSTEAFYQDHAQYKMTIRPWYQGETLTGYLRFDYKVEDQGVKTRLIITEGTLLCMAIFLLSIMLYFRAKMIKPFSKMSELPLELAKGHLHGEVKDEKNKYFGRFLWGISQLKDTLEVSKLRQLELEKERKQMLLSLSHDVKTPLNTIKLYGKALEDDIYTSEAEKKHAAHQIGEKTVEIQKYVEEIIKTSREDILHIQVKNGEFYLDELMKSVLDTYGETCQLRQVELNVKQYENCLLRGDLDRSREVVENIIENAFKYGDGRRIEIDCYEEDYCLLMRVFNTGTVVSDNELNHIFESFFRGSNSASQQGNGLGLYICRQIMRKMDGEIFAEKKEDGMAFTLVFR